MEPTAESWSRSTTSYFVLRKRVAGGEELLRSLGKGAALRCTTLWDDCSRQWFVVTTLYPDSASPIKLGRELAEEFPSELLTAQIMLVA